MANAQNDEPTWQNPLRLWPGVVRTTRRFKRPQHSVFASWRRFDTPLKLKPEIDLSALPPVDDHGMRLTQRAPVRSEAVRKLLDGWEAERGESSS